MWLPCRLYIFQVAALSVAANYDESPTCSFDAPCLNEHYKFVAQHVPPVPDEDVAVVHRMVDGGAQGVKKSDSGIWFFEQLLRPEVVVRVLERLPNRESDEWIPCPRIEHNPKKRCFMLPIRDDPLLQEVVTSFKAAWGQHLDITEITHLAINRVIPGKSADELHADVFTGRPGHPRISLERPTAHNIIYLTEQPRASEESKELARTKHVTELDGNNVTTPLIIPLSEWRSTKQWPERPQDDAKCGINIIYLTQQPTVIQPEESGQLKFPRAGVTITPKAGAMISFAMTDDNDHLVGPFTDNAPEDRISIQFPVSVFGAETAKAYPEFVGNGPSPPSPPSPPAPPTPNPCANASTACTYERGTAKIGDWLEMGFNDQCNSKEEACVVHRHYLPFDHWCEYDAVFYPVLPWNVTVTKHGCAVWKPGSYNWMPDPNGPHYRCVTASHEEMIV